MYRILLILNFFMLYLCGEILSRICIQNLNEVFISMEHCHIHVYPTNVLELEKFSVPLQTTSKQVTFQKNTSKWWDLNFVQNITKNYSSDVFGVRFKSMLLSHKHLNCIVLIQINYPSQSGNDYNEISTYYRRNSMWNDILVIVGNIKQTFRKWRWVRSLYFFTGINLFFDIKKHDKTNLSITSTVYTFVDEKFHKLENCKNASNYQICLKNYFFKYLKGGRNMILQSSSGRRKHHCLWQRLYVLKSNKDIANRTNFFAEKHLRYSFSAPNFGFWGRKNASIENYNDVKNFLNKYIRNPFRTYNFKFLFNVFPQIVVVEHIPKSNSLDFTCSMLMNLLDAFSIYKYKTCDLKLYLREILVTFRDFSSFNIENLIPKSLAKFSKLPYNDLIMTNTIKLNFATCNGVERIQGIQHYFIPFDTYSWMLTFTFNFIIIPLFLVIVTKLLVFSTFFFLFYYNNIMFFSIATILEAGFNFPSLSKFTEKYYKIIIGCWFLILVVLVNGYKGVFTSHVLSPIQLSTKWTNLKANMSHFDFIMYAGYIGAEVLRQKNSEDGKKNSLKTMIFNMECHYCSLNFKLSKSCETMWNRFKSVNKFYAKVENVSRFQNYVSGLPKNEEFCLKYEPPVGYYYNSYIFSNLTRKALLPIFNEKTTIMINVIESTIGNYPKYERIYKVIKSCRDIAYFDTEHRLNGFLAYTNALSRSEASIDEFEKDVPHFYTGTVSWNEIWDGYMLPSHLANIHMYYFKKRLYDLIEFGIYQIWLKWDQILATTGNSEAKHYVQKLDKMNLKYIENKPKVLTLKGKVTSVFIIACVMLCYTHPGNCI